MSEENSRSRIVSLDVLRGIVMAIMALDHVRDNVHYGGFFNDPTNLATTNPALFFTRWITHFCAPTFVFLAGAAAFLYGVRQPGRKNTARFLLTRGLWLILMEFTVVNLAITYDIHFSLHILQVIWTIGFCLVCLSGLIWLPRAAQLGIGLLLVFGHNLLDGIRASGYSPLEILWYFLHQQNLIPTSAKLESAILVAYPVLPWIGVILLGYRFGELYQPGADAVRRQAFLWKTGLGAIALFALLRTFNIYGDPVPWGPQHDFAFSVISFFNVTKYPPSLIYLLMTLGPGFLFLYLAETRFKNPAGFFATIGRVPFFYYIGHFYLAHFMGVLGMWYAGRPWTDIIFSMDHLLHPVLQNYGYSLGVTYAAWLLVVLTMYPLCKWYDRYKREHRDYWWLSYL